MRWRLVLLWLAVATVLVLPRAAHAETLALEGALAQADRTSAVIRADLDAADAERAARRTEADPLALRIDRAQAEQALEMARAEADATRFGAYQDIAAAYAQVLAAQAQRELAEASLDLAERGVQIARLRFERGGATELEVRDAENERAEAANGVAAARQGEALARRSLRSLIGEDASDLAPVPGRLLAVPVPDEEALVARLGASGPLLQVEQGVALARIGVELLDPSYAPAAQIDQAELQLEQAQEGAREARRGAELQ
ncbi:MAG: TolC family protein, partial [Trueperaceae bacterium]